MKQIIRPDGSKYAYHNNCWPSGFIFVFGSNASGVHGAGAAKYAKEWCGAVMYKGEGLSGLSYALPTKDRRIRTLPLCDISQNVKTFLECAMNHPDRKFYITRVGCGLAGYRDDQIAPLFREAPANCYFPIEWLEYLEK